MKILTTLILFISITAKADSLLSENDPNQEDLVLHDLEQIQNHGKKWQSKLKKATSATQPYAGRQALNEG